MTLHSMTAFARELCQSPAPIAVELRSVNHRYLDCHFKLPDALRAIEPRLREALGRELSRGKVDCLLRIQGEGATNALALNHDRLRQVAAALGELRSVLPDAGPPDTLALLQFPGVCSDGGDDGEAIGAAAVELFTRALASLAATRAREGKQLGEFLDRRLAALEAEVAALRAELPALRQRQEERLRRRLAELEQPVDDGRLEQELVRLLQKSDVDEELDRLDAHVAEIRRVLDAGGPCGRRLDFLMQELNREANTLSSKATTSGTTQRAVELKVLIEQMREQIQNIE